MWEKHIASTDRVAHELRTLVDILEESGSFDQLNLGGLVPLEIAARRVNLIVDAYKLGGAPSYANAKYLTPLGDADEIIAPSLRSHIARRAKDDWEAVQYRKKAGSVRAQGAAGATASDGGGGRAGGGDAERRGRGGGRGRGLPPPVQT